MGSSVDRHTEVLVKIIEKSLMMPGNNKYVARVDGLHVHEGHNEIVCVDQARLQSPSHQLAEQAVVLRRDRHLGESARQWSLRFSNRTAEAAD